jgi:hypothetical protein
MRFKGAFVDLIEAKARVCFDESINYLLDKGGLDVDNLAQDLGYHWLG